MHRLRHVQPGVPVEHAARRQRDRRIHEVHFVRTLRRAVPNGAIKFIDWEDIAQKVIDQGVVRTTTLVQA